jgi:RNA polymerase-binding transcription factor DksA
MGSQRSRCRKEEVIRRHFHRCGHLRVIELDARDLSHARKGSSQVLEELCEAKHLAPCVGLAECDVLAPGQKRELLAARATHLREEEGGTSPLADAREGDPRTAELAELRDTLLAERNAIAQENRRRAAEAGGALQRNPRPLGRGEEGDLRSAGVSVVLDDELRALRAARLDALDRALDALGRGRYGGCVRCGAPIEIARLQETPDTVLCAPCARGVSSDARIPEFRPRITQL